MQKDNQIKAIDELNGLLSDLDEDKIEEFESILKNKVHFGREELDLQKNTPLIQLL